SYLDDIAMVTVQGQKIGTPAFMSPEQVAGNVHMTHSVDIYALGIILYQLLTGKVPFVGKPGHIYTHILNTEPDAPSTLRAEIPRQLDAICLRALQKKPEDRFGTMAEFAGYLDRFLQEVSPAGPAGGGPGRHDLEDRLKQALAMLQQRTEQLQQIQPQFQQLQAQFQALAQAATAERERRLTAEAELDISRKQVQQVRSEAQKLQAAGGALSEDQRRQFDDVQRQLQDKTGENQMLRKMWQAAEQKHNFDKEE